MGQYEFNASAANPLGTVILLFTDLQGSTALYERVGDAGAYHLVREHFAFPATVVRERNGNIVKTIGGAVMAAFIYPADAVKAALEVQGTVAGFNESPGSRGPRNQAPYSLRIMHCRDAQ